jgi:ABC-type transporter Mla subunit MlaD
MPASAAADTMSGSGAPMTMQPQDIQPALGHLEGALEATCATLVALESINTSAGEITDNTRAVQGQIREAVKSLREAIDELRKVHDAHTSLLAFGFVLGTRPGRPPAEDGDS